MYDELTNDSFVILYENRLQKLKKEDPLKYGVLKTKRVNNKEYLYLSKKVDKGGIMGVVDVYERLYNTKDNFRIVDYNTIKYEFPEDFV